MLSTAMWPMSQGKKRDGAHVEETRACWVGRVLASTRVVWLQFGEGSIQVYSLVDRKHRKVVSQDRGMSCVYSRIEHTMRT